MNNTIPEWATHWNKEGGLFVGERQWGFGERNPQMKNLIMTNEWFGKMGYPLEEIYIQLEND